MTCKEMFYFTFLNHDYNGHNYALFINKLLSYSAKQYLKNQIFFMGNCLMHSSLSEKILIKIAEHLLIFPLTHTPQHYYFERVFLMLKFYIKSKNQNSVQRLMISF